MQPDTNPNPIPNPNSQPAPLPVEHQPQGRPEQPAPPAAPEVAPVGSPVALPPSVPVASPPAAAPPTQPPSQPAPAVGANPAVAADADVIEKEWVDQAEKIIAQTKDDPYAEEEAEEALQQDYLKKRYNHDVKKPDAG